MRLANGRSSSLRVALGLGALALAFLIGRASVRAIEDATGPLSVRVVDGPAPESTSNPPPGSPVVRQVARVSEAPPAVLEARPPVTDPPSTRDLGVDALTRLVDKARDPEAMRARTAGYLAPTLDGALADKHYNPRELALTQEERAKFEAWVDGFDAVIKRLAIESHELTYSEVLRRIASGNEQWIEASTSVEVATALGNQHRSDFVVQTDMGSRETVSAYLTSKYAGTSVKHLSTGGARPGTTRFAVFVAGDGSRVIETERALDEAQTFRRQAIRDYLQRLPR